MRVVWSDQAITDLREIRDYIGRDSSDAAFRTVRRIFSHDSQLRRFPESGRIVPEYETAEVREVIEGNYRILYTIECQEVWILAIVHGSRQLPAAFRSENR
ncbi:MAG: type II toxin-antitoxin system RelE/ParE family toxin [Spirochaetaceae bacterium]|nr:type II toxin-antitoxin system RelE/ParE family toxin [Spirochaetaceae bacterium]